jgi:hypothetical protein
VIGLVLGGEACIAGSSTDGLDFVEELLLFGSEVTHGGGEDFVELVCFNVRLDHFYLLKCLKNRMQNRELNKLSGDGNMIATKQGKYKYQGGDQSKYDSVDAFTATTPILEIIESVEHTHTSPRSKIGLTNDMESTINTREINAK